MQFLSLHSLSLDRRSTLLTAGVLSLLLLLAYHYVSYREDYQETLTQIDRSLSIAAHAVDKIIGPDFHRQTFTAETIPWDRELTLAMTLTDFARESGLDYVYTMILDGEQIRFVSSSQDQEKLQQGELESFYWMVYDDADPMLFQVFKSGEPAYVEYQDQWGSYRSLFLPRTTASGKTYVIGADVNVRQLRQVAGRSALKALVNLAVLLVVLALWNITLTRQNAEISRSRKRYNLIVSAGAVGFWEWDLVNDRLSISPEFFSELGIAGGKLPRNAEEVMAIIHPDDADTFRLRATSTVSAGELNPMTEEFEFRLRKADDNYVWLRSQAETIEWTADGKPLWRAGVLENIDKFKRSQFQLEQSKKSLKAREHFLKTLLNNLPDLVSFKDYEGVYRHCNKMFRNMFGVDPEQVIGKTDLDFLPFHIAESLRENDCKALASPEPLRVEEWLVFAEDDNPRLIETIKTRLAEDEKGAYGVLSIGRDITRLHTLISELDKFHRFAEFSGQGLVIITLHAEVSYMNPMFRRLVFNPHRLRDQTELSLLEFYGEELHATLENQIIPTTRENGIWTGELPMLGANGHPIDTLQTFFVMLSEKGVPVFIGVIVTDITAQKKIERELEDSRAAEEFANKSKSLFLANMSHEIRTPLNAVLGYAQLLAQRSEIDGEAHHQVTQIYNAGSRLLALINDILDLSKIEAGKLTLTHEPFDLNRELADLANMMRQRAFSKGVDLRLALSIPEPAPVLLDRQKLGQILINLLSNAVKFTSDGYVELSCREKDEGLEIAVADTGAGISEEELKLLFNPFTQGRQGERLGGGTGLGLVLAKRFTELMGGELILSSEQGQGTRVTVRLPATICADQALEERPQQHGYWRLADNEQCDLLVIDDDEDSRVVLSALLENMGFQVTVLESAIDVVKLLKDTTFAAVLTDIRMPEYTGVDLLHDIRANLPNVGFPVVAVTASSLEHERSFYLRQGFDDFISKPVELDDVVRVLRLHLPVTLVPVAENGEDTAQSADESVLPLAPASPPACGAEDRGLLVQIQDAAREGDPDRVTSLCHQLSAKMRETEFYRQLLTAVEGYDLAWAEASVQQLLEILES